MDGKEDFMRIRSDHITPVLADATGLAAADYGYGGQHHPLTSRFVWMRR